MDVPTCLLPLAPHGLSEAHLSDSAAEAVATLAGKLRATTFRLSHELSSPQSVMTELYALRQHVRKAFSSITSTDGAEFFVLRAEDTESLTELPYSLLQLSEQDFERLLPVFQRYDSYFCSRRSNQVSRVYLLLQLLDTLNYVLNDMADCLLDTNEMRAIVNAAATIFECESVQAGAARSHPDEDNSLFPEQDSYQRDVEPDLREASLYRWKLGHHIFNLFTTYASLELIKSTSAQDEAQCARSIENATVLLRATTAAMWYAEAFPVALYVDHIRPSMVDASGQGSGFSGTDNLEFRFFRTAIRGTFDELNNLYGPSDTWSDDLWTAAYRFWDARELDLEHHILLAEKVVGHEPSLKQIRLMQHSGTPDAAKDLPAVEALRSLRDAARTTKEQLL
jgi:hypothetical protein